MVLVNVGAYHNVNMPNSLLFQILCRPYSFGRCFFIFDIFITAAVNEHHKSAFPAVSVGNLHQYGVPVSYINKCNLRCKICHMCHVLIAFLIYTALITSTNIVITMAQALAKPNFRVFMP